MDDTFKIRITAQDVASGVIKKINTGLGGMGKPMKKGAAAIQKLGQVSKTSFKEVERGLREVARSAGLAVGKLDLLSVGGIAGGLIAVTDKFANFSFSLNRSSKMLGMNTQDLAEWHYAAKQAGVSAESFDQSMSDSQMTIRNMYFGGDNAGLTMMQKMGVQIQTNKDGSIDYYKTQMKMMEALRKIPTVEGQRAAAAALGMSALLPMIQQGTYEIDKLTAARKGLAGADTEKGVQFWHDLQGAEASVEGLANAIGADLVPILGPLVNQFANWLDKNRVAIAQEIADAVGKLVDWLKQVDWAGLGKDAKEWWDRLGGVKGVLEIIAGITLAGPIAGVANLAGALLTLTASTIPAAATALGTLGVAGVAAWGALKVAKMAGLPDTDQQQGIADVSAGDWLSASTHLPAADFLRAMAARTGGKSNAEIAAMLQGGMNPAAPESSARLPKGIRTQNPLNVEPPSGHMVFDTAEEGIAAAVKNLESKRYQGKTMAQIQDIWTGGARVGNTPQQIANYGKIMTAGTGLGADVIPDLKDPRVVGAMVASMIRAENSMQPYSPEVIGNATVAGMQQAGLNPPDAQHVQTGPITGPDTERARNVAALQQGAPTVNVTVNHAPPGTRVEATSSDGTPVPTRVQYSMPVSMTALP